MSGQLWIRGPIGLDAERRATRAGCRVVLVLVPTIAAGSRLLDLLGLFENDHRIQTVFTVPESTETWAGTDEFLRKDGRLVLPWAQALQHRFDLVVAASYTGLDQVRGTILVLPHGAGSLMSRAGRSSAGEGDTAPDPVGLARETLMYRGRVLPSAVALTHDRELDALRRSCPPALPAAVVAGDICYDRMAASQPRRDEYRRSLDVGPGQRLVTVSSTWSTASVFGQHPGLCQRLLAQLPGDRYRVALVLHPSVWAVHGWWQLRAWLADSLHRGLLVVPPEEGWRATVIASDWVIGDYGSTTQYAAATGTPVIIGAFPEQQIRTGSLAWTLARTVPRLDPDRPVLSQLRRAAERTITAPAFADLLTSRPHRAAGILRRTAYRFLGLDEPSRPAVALPIPLPAPLRP